MSLHMQVHRHTHTQTHTHTLHSLYQFVLGVFLEGRVLLGQLSGLALEGGNGLLKCFLILHSSGRVIYTDVHVITYACTTNTMLQVEACPLHRMGPHSNHTCLAVSGQGLDSISHTATLPTPSPPPPPPHYRI